MTYHKHETTEIKEGGLRYSRKKNGSPFEGQGKTGEMMSAPNVAHTNPARAVRFADC